MTLRVLVVENDQTLADTFGLILRKSGHVTDIAYTGQDAIALLEEFQPDVLISDVLMPGISGIELARFVLAKLTNCKVVLISGDHELIGLLEQFTGRRNFVQIFTKPVHPQKILDLIASLDNISNPQAPRPT